MEADEDAPSEKKSDNGDVRSLLSGSDDGADDEERVNNKVNSVSDLMMLAHPSFTSELYKVPEDLDRAREKALGRLYQNWKDNQRIMCEGEPSAKSNGGSNAKNRKK